MIKRKLKIIVLILALIFCALGYLLMSETINNSFDSALTLYVRNQKYSFNKDTKYKLKDDGSLVVNYGNIVVDPNSSPLYSLNNDSMVLTNKFVFVKPTLSDILVRLKLYPLTEIKNSNGVITVSKKSKNINETGGFLYDGDNMYVILEQGKLVYGGKEVTLGPLSFVRVKAGEEIEYFDTISNEYVDVLFEKLVTVVTDSYEINVSMDTVKYGSKETYVPSTVDSLNDYFEGENKR